MHMKLSSRRRVPQLSYRLRAVWPAARLRLLPQGLRRLSKISAAAQAAAYVAGKLILQVSRRISQEAAIICLH